MIGKFVGSAAVMGAGYGKQAPLTLLQDDSRAWLDRVCALSHSLPRRHGMGVIILNRILAHGRLKCEGALR